MNMGRKKGRIGGNDVLKEVLEWKSAWNIF